MKLSVDDRVTEIAREATSFRMAVAPWASYRWWTGSLNAGGPSPGWGDPRHSPSFADRPGLISLSGNTAVLSLRSEENFSSVIHVSQLLKHRQTPLDTFSLCNTPFLWLCMPMWLTECVPVLSDAHLVNLKPHNIVHMNVAFATLKLVVSLTFSLTVYDPHTFRIVLTVALHCSLAIWINTNFNTYFIKNADNQMKTVKCLSLDSVHIFCIRTLFKWVIVRSICE